MDGKTLLRELRVLLQEQSSSSWLDDKTSYDYLYKAAIEFVTRTRINTSTQAITTVADQSAYKLNADFLQPQLYDLNGELKPFIKYYDGSSYSFLRFRDYDPIYLDNNTTSQSTPSYWTVTDYAAESNQTGTAATGSDAAQVNGEATLIGSGTSWLTSVSVGDTVHNTTDASSGYVMAVTDDTHLETALFDGTTNAWNDGTDAYIIVPQGKFQLILDPPPSTAGHTATVPYVQRPAPVYSPYRSYRLPIDYTSALVYYAAWMYKNRDREPNYADMEMKYFEDQVRKACVQYGKALNRKGFRVNMMKRSQETGSWR